MYNIYIRGRPEYNTVVFHSSLTQEQSDSLAQFEAVCLGIIIQEMFISNSAVCEMLGLRKFFGRKLGASILERDVQNIHRTSEFFPKHRQ